MRRTDEIVETGPGFRKTSRGRTLPRGASEGGFSARAWRHECLSFLALPDIPAGELGRFVEEFRRRAD